MEKKRWIKNFDGNLNIRTKSIFAETTKYQKLNLSIYKYFRPVMDVYKTI